MKKIEFSQEQIEDIINKYQNEKISATKIGKIYGVSKAPILRVLKENEVEIIQHRHKFEADYNIFENIDSQEKAYWLGFLAADGCNYERQYNASIILNIHQKDRDHLEKFRAFMKSNVKIIDYIQDVGFSNNTPMCKITFNSKKMSADLTDKGVVPNKSLILQKPNISEEYYLSFILGYFDGDGSISRANQYNNFSISIQGTNEMLEWINSILNISSHLEKRTQNEKNNFYIRCGGTLKPYKILKQLYEKSPVCLTRKFLIYKELETVVINEKS